MGPFCWHVMGSLKLNSLGITARAKDHLLSLVSLLMGVCGLISVNVEVLDMGKLGTTVIIIYSHTAKTQICRLCFPHFSMFTFILHVLSDSEENIPLLHYIWKMKRFRSDFKFDELLFNTSHISLKRYISWLLPLLI